MSQFFNITLPLLKPVLIPAVTLGAIWTFNNLNVVWLVSNGGEPSDKTHILVTYVYKAAFFYYRYGYAAAFSVFIFLCLVVIVQGYNRASREEAYAISVQATLSCPWFRCYTHTDVIGVELGGALKNVIAIAVGISDGMGNGNNARAALMTLSKGLERESQQRMSEVTEEETEVIANSSTVTSAATVLKVTTPIDVMFAVPG